MAFPCFGIIDKILTIIIIIIAKFFTMFVVVHVLLYSKYLTMVIAISLYEFLKESNISVF